MKIATFPYHAGHILAETTKINIRCLPKLQNHIATNVLCIFQPKIFEVYPFGQSFFRLFDRKYPGTAQPLVFICPLPFHGDKVFANNYYTIKYSQRLIPLKTKFSFFICFFLCSILPFCPTGWKQFLYICLIFSSSKTNILSNFYPVAELPLCIGNYSCHADFS